MHIAFFNRSFYPDTAATGQLLTDLCEDLVRDYGCKVSVVAGVPLLSAERAEGRPGGRGIVGQEEHNGVRILRARGTRFPKHRFSGRVANYLSYFLSACYAGMRLEQPDVVVALTDPPIIGLAAFLAAKRFGVPLVMSYRDIFPEVACLLEDFRSRRIEWVLQQVNCFLAQRAERVIALGETMRQRLISGKGADSARTIIIPDWADCSDIVPCQRENAFSREIGLLDSFVVMHSGNIGLSQELEAVVEAAKYLTGTPKIQFVFVGEGVKKPRLVERAKVLGLPNIRFLPYQPKSHLNESFAAADVFVVSLKHGLSGYIVPSKLYGILAAGRPYVAAIEEDSEVATIARKYECGLLAEPGNAVDIAEKIRTLYQNPDLVQQMGKNARAAALKFDRPVQVRAYYELFCDLSGKRGLRMPSSKPTHSGEEP